MTKQDYQTQPELLDAVVRRFGGLDWDLAATAENSAAARFISPRQNSLFRAWPIDAYPRVDQPVNLWLNPPFANIDPWVEKCCEWVHKATARSRLLLLVPASIGSNWWTHHVSGRARVLALSPRLRFVGCEDVYPRDCALCVYEPAWPEQPRSVEPWRWDEPFVHKEDSQMGGLRAGRTDSTEESDEPKSCDASLLYAGQV